MTDYDEPRVRLELLIGLLSDQLSPARELISGLRLRSNTSSITRAEVDHLSDVAGSIWERLGQIREELSRFADPTRW